MERERLTNETISSFGLPKAAAESIVFPMYSGLLANGTSVENAGEYPIVDEPLGKSTIEILDHVLSLRPAIQIPKEIWEVSEELVSRCENLGMTDDRLSLLLRAVLFLDRRFYRHSTS